jgi:hypothetical protein
VSRRIRRQWHRPYLVATVAAVLLVGGAVVAYDPGDDENSGLPDVTRYGTAVQPNQGETDYRAQTRIDDALGRQDLVRVFYAGAPKPWPGDAPRRNVVVSFKLAPADVIAGRDDSMMRTWFAKAPRRLDVYWSYWHEPEDDVAAGKFTPADFRAAFEHLDKLAKEAHNPRLKSTVILQSWSTVPGSGRDWRDYFPNRRSVDILAWDVYNRGGHQGRYMSPALLLDAPRRAAESVGKPFAVAELGSILVSGDDGSRRAAWLRSMGAYLEQYGAVFGIYFDFLWNDGDDDFRLRDRQSMRAWRQISMNP